MLGDGEHLLFRQAAEPNAVSKRDHVRPTPPLFDHLVGAAKQRCGNGEARDAFVVIGEIVPQAWGVTWVRLGNPCFPATQTCKRACGPSRQPVDGAGMVDTDDTKNDGKRHRHDTEGI